LQNFKRKIVMNMAATTKHQVKKTPPVEDTTVSSSHGSVSETGAQIGIPLFMRCLTPSATNPAMIQRQPIEEEEEELLQTKPADDVIQRQPIEEEEELLQPKPAGGEIQRQPIDEEEMLQAKLKVGPPNDVYEQEADHVAEQVMRMPAPGVQPKPN
jgi:hypothetical protein